jgi:hypothetical protein
VTQGGEQEKHVGHVVKGIMNPFTQLVLRTSASGLPLEWLDYQQAAHLYHLDKVLYPCGSPLFRLRGGISAATGRQSVLVIHSIIATVGEVSEHLTAGYVPLLSNRTLFKRDGHLCLYCGERFLCARLSRDHVRPISRGGSNTWNNVVTACRRCNNRKAGHLPEEAGMQLLAIPFTPNHAEYVYLQGRRILADQMAFLRAHFPRSSPFHARRSVDEETTYPGPVSLEAAASGSA